MVDFGAKVLRRKTEAAEDEGESRRSFASPENGRRHQSPLRSTWLIDSVVRRKTQTPEPFGQNSEGGKKQA
ncbi:hypothetical protein GN956_G18629 [Arapaima gigas]